MKLIIDQIRFIKYKADMREELNKKLKRREELLDHSVACVLENPKDVINIAGVIRNCDGLGVSKIYIVDGFNRAKNLNISKTMSNRSVSASSYIDYEIFEDSNELFDHLTKEGFVNILTSPHDRGNGTHYEIGDANWKLFKKVAVWFGNEAMGISKDILSRGESYSTSFSMRGMVESFNLATTSGIFLHHIMNDRNNKH